ncbi:hypothetical protein [Pseudoflavonifractor sp. 524-17]|uniref:hypothetical protein n=1 Tax=Pseudoflavonifractor sp. 524-17 TaxID=2304577 RepID=UPI00137B2959|nr:hypothetical protein [Pseudoflavonifractor sp. 524-17]
MRKRLVSAFVLVVMVLSLGTAHAAPRWNKIWTCNSSFSISGTTASCYLDVTADPGTKITANIKVVRVNSNGSETPVCSWRNLTGTGSYTFDRTFTSSLLSPSGTYRMYYTVDADGVDYIDNYVVYKK